MPQAIRYLQTPPLRTPKSELTCGLPSGFCRAWCNASFCSHWSWILMQPRVSINHSAHQSLSPFPMPLQTQWLTVSLFALWLWVSTVLAKHRFVTLETRASVRNTSHRGIDQLVIQLDSVREGSVPRELSKSLSSNKGSTGRTVPPLTNPHMAPSLVNSCIRAYMWFSSLHICKNVG